MAKVFILNDSMNKTSGKLKVLLIQMDEGEYRAKFCSELPVIYPRSTVKPKSETCARYDLTRESERWGHSPPISPPSVPRCDPARCAQ
jgi:hypothetical protein